MLLGSIYGFILAWGPIWWGLIGLLSGAVIGFAIKLSVTKKYANNRVKGNIMSEVVLIIECKEHELEIVSSLLWNNHALGVSKLDFTNTSYLLAKQE